MKINRITAHLALFIVALIYGANYSIAKEVLDNDYISPMGLVLFRISTSLILFFVVHLLFIKENIERKDILRLLACGILGVFLNQSFFLTGLKFTTPINASVLMVTTPIFVLVISILLKEEKVTWLKISGVVLGASGTLLLILSKGSLDFSGTLKGDVLVLINAFAYSLYLVIVKPLMIKYNPITVIKWIFLFGLIPVFPLGFEGASRVDWSSFSTAVWIAFLYVLILTTFFTYLLNAMALKVVKPSTVGIYIYLQPVLATIVALSLGKDELTGIKILSGMIIILGVYLVSTNKIKLFQSPKV
jgi:drug/metabolite transporter (DMT)-like permease